MQSVIEVFLGYAIQDQELCLEIKKRLKWLEKSGFIKTWHEFDIQAGLDRETEIYHHLACAHIILLFISADFINSEFCYGVELQQAIERHQRETVRVIPIILRAVYWQGTPLGTLQPLPRNNVPIMSCPNLDEILANIEEEIRMIVHELAAERYLQEGRLLLNEKHYERVIEACEFVLKWSSNSNIARTLKSLANRLKGAALLKLEKYDESLAAYEQIILIDDNDASLYKERGDVLNFLRRYEDAIFSYKKAILLKSTLTDEDLIDVYMGASRAYKELSLLNSQFAKEYEEKARVLLASQGSNI